MGEEGQISGGYMRESKLQGSDRLPVKAGIHFMSRMAYNIVIGWDKEPMENSLPARTLWSFGCQDT